MGLFTSLINTTNAMSVYGRVFNTLQNNITNANTPGYVRQDQSLVASSFDPSQGLTGGVTAGPLLSARSEYLEQNVRSQQQLLGDAGQRASDLGQVEPLFSLTSTGGISSSMDSFFNSSSQLSVNPSDPVARQSVIDSATQVARSFNDAAAGIARVSSGADSQIRSTVSQINTLTGQIATLNKQFRANSTAAQDPGLDAQMHSALESLSSLANFSTIKTADGSVSVYLGGQTPLVAGDHQFPISADFSSPQTVVRDSLSNDVTSQITSGSLGALTKEKNTTLPGYLANLNTLAQNFADQVNGQLAQGVDKNGAAPSTNLFAYNSASDAASSLAVTGITGDQIAAADPSAPGGNANAIALAKLASAPTVNGFTFTQAYGNLGSQLGRDVASAKSDVTQFQDLVTQAQQQRSDQTGVDVNAEAAKLLQFQQAYQAAGKMVSVLDTLTQTLINLIP